MEEFEKAVDDYTTAIELDPDHALSHYNRGIAYDALGKHDLAIADYGWAIELEPNSVRAYVFRADSYLRLEEQEASMADLETALALADTVDDIAFIEGEIVRLTKPPPTPVPTPTPQPSPDYVHYEDSGGRFSFIYPQQWSILAGPGGILVAAPGDEGPTVIVLAEEATEPASAQELMEFFKLGLAEEPGYIPVGDEQVTIGDLVAAKHLFRVLDSPDFGNVDVVGVAIVARRGNNVVILIGMVAETAYESQKATLDRIIDSLVVK